MYVRSWMTRPAVTAFPDMSLYDASLLMSRKGIRRLPVTRDRRLVGIVTRSDLEATMGRFRRRSQNSLRKARETSVASVMTENPVTVSPGDTLEDAAQKMLRKKISGLPVVEGDELSGMITESDIFRALCTILGFGRGGGRVVLSLKPDGDLLGQLQRAVGRYTLQGIVSYMNPETRRVEAVVRVRGRRPRVTRVS